MVFLTEANTSSQQAHRITKATNKYRTLKGVKSRALTSLDSSAGFTFTWFFSVQVDGRVRTSFWVDAD